MSFYDFIDILSTSFSGVLNSKLFMPAFVIIFIGIGFVLFRNRQKTKYVYISDINAFNITLKLNTKNIDIAYMMFVELTTRKIGIEFEENDVIVEVYESWYSAFKTIRELLLTIRPTPKNKELIEIGTSILNKSLRPHLTKWQAKYRKWYEIEINKDANKNFTPQEIQRTYPEYDELVKDLQLSHRETLNFVKQLKGIFE